MDWNSEEFASHSNENNFALFSDHEICEIAARLQELRCEIFAIHQLGELRS